MKILIRITILMTLLVFVFNFSKTGAQFLFFGNPLEGKQAPEFTLNTLRQDNVSFSKYRDGQPAILFFWTTWCLHCRTVLRDLEKQYPLITEKGIKVFLVNIGETRKHISSYLEHEAIDIDVFLDKDGSASSQYHVVGVPTFILVNASGAVVSVKHDLDDRYEQFLFPK